MFKKYSAVQEELDFQVDRKMDERLAHLTHLLQNRGGVPHQFYEDFALDYLEDKFQGEFRANQWLQETSTIDWDIPFPPVKNPEFTFIDLFAGIGGIRMGYQSRGGKCVFTSEWDNFAKKTYHANFGEVPFGDITKMSEDMIPDHDVLLAGFPCQPFSIAGVSKKKSLGRNHGFLDETQGTLFFDVARIIRAKRPKCFMLENVKNLVSHDKGRTFEIISGTLKELGYTLHFKVMDGQEYVPQHRERIIIVGFDESVFEGKEEFSFPEAPPRKTVFRSILEDKVDEKYTLSDKLWSYLQVYAAKHKAKGNGFGFGMTNLDGVSRTLSARYYKDGSEVLIPQARGKNPRRMTPRECARLQGFPDDFIIPVSDNQAYKQYGNSVVVPLMVAIAGKVKNELTRINEPVPA